MAVPKKRTSSTKQGMRRSHLALKATKTGVCSHCGKTVRPHTACAACGYYNSKQVIKV